MNELSSNQGVLFFKNENGELGFHESGDENKDKKYIGEIKNSLPNGQGTYTNLNGYKYVGEFKDGGRHGKGTYTWSNGRMYVGEFKDGEEWNGTETDKEGNVIGKWVNGVLQK